MRSLLAFPERRPGLTIVAIGVAMAVAYLTAMTAFPRSHGRVVDGDAIQYYAYLRSLAIDRDVDFTNDYALLYTTSDETDPAGNVWLTRRTDTGRVENMMSIGPAVLWAPFFLATYLTIALLRPIGLSIPLDGLAPPFPLSAGIAGIVYAALGAYLCYRSCRLLFPPAPSVWAALVAWLATSVVYYSVISPAYSHSTSLFAAALFVFVWLVTRGDDRMRRYGLVGALAGLAALVRWQDAVIVVLPLGELAASVAKGRRPLGSVAVRAGLMGCVILAALIPQLLAWRAIYGEFFVMPQGAGFMRWTEPAVLSVLFSLNHGLFSWTPAVLLAAVGLPLLIRRDAVLGWSALVVLTLAVYINAAVSDWWAGEAFGARRFIAATPLFALGLAAVFSTWRWRDRPAALRWTACSLVAYNLLFVLQYQLYMRGYQALFPYPSTIRQVLLDRLILPWRLLEIWLS